MVWLFNKAFKINMVVFKLLEKNLTSFEPCKLDTAVKISHVTIIFNKKDPVASKLS